MRSARYRFFGLLSNVDHTITSVSFGSRLRVRRRTATFVREFLADLEGLPEHEVHFTLERWSCLSPDYRYVWTIEGASEVPVLTAEMSDEEKHANWVAEDEFYTRVYAVARLLRLFKEGSIEVAAAYLYEREPHRQNSFNSSRQQIAVNESTLYTLTDHEVDHFAQFVERVTLPFRHEYLNLAYEHLEQSYDVDHERLKYLLLMIAAEILFNDGGGELQYRIARGVTVLLSNSLTEAEVLFNKAKALYRKRSALVHSGDGGITRQDVLDLRDLIRRSLLRVAAMDCAKPELSKQLTAGGFASGPAT